MIVFAFVNGLTISHSPTMLYHHSFRVLVSVAVTSIRNIYSGRKDESCWRRAEGGDGVGNGGGGGPDEIISVMAFLSQQTLLLETLKMTCLHGWPHPTEFHPSKAKNTMKMRC